MHLKAPEWWFTAPRSGTARLQQAGLAPLAFAYGAISRARWRLVRPYKSRLPVLCVGNFTAGGAGKTPTALALATLAEELGFAPVFLSRGYGGKIRGPHLVHKGDSAASVGDEPLLLAARAPTVIAADRRAGARYIEQTLARDGRPALIIMDDGFQNPGLYKELSVLVVDGAMGIGNGRVIPAGPLRAPLGFQIQRADILIVNGAGQGNKPGADSIVQAMEARGKPVFQAQVEAAPDGAALKGREVIAYAGIARPQTFFDLLDALGVRVRMRLPYGDHHVYSEADARFLLELARAKKLDLVTTQKDLVRLPHQGPAGELKARSLSLPIRLKIKGADRLRDEMRAVLGAGLP